MLQCCGCRRRRQCFNPKNVVTCGMDKPTSSWPVSHVKQSTQLRCRPTLREFRLTEIRVGPVQTRPNFTRLNNKEDTDTLELQSCRTQQCYSVVVADGVGNALIPKTLSHVAWTNRRLPGQCHMSNSQHSFSAAVKNLQRNAAGVGTHFWVYRHTGCLSWST